MFATRTCLFSLFLLIVPAQQQPAQDSAGTAPLVKLADGSSTVVMNLDGARLEDFVRAAQPFLELPVNYEPAVLSVYRITQPGELRVPRASFRDAFDSVLRRYDIWDWDDTSSGAAVITLFKPTPGRGHGMLPFTPRMVTFVELDAGPVPRLPMYTVTIPLQNIEARDQLNLIQPLFDTSMEFVRPADAANALVISATPEHLRAAQALLQTLDVATVGPGGGQYRVAALERQVGDLVLRVQKLEAAGH